MKIKSMLVPAVAIALQTLLGCGSPSTETKPTEPAKTVDAAPEAPKGLGISQAQLTKGLTGLELEQLEGKSEGDNVYKGSATDAAGKLSLIAYGTPKLVTHIYFTGTSDKLQDALLANVFGGKVPADITTGLAWAKDNATKEKTVNVDGKIVKIKVDSDKSTSFDVKQF